MYLEMSRGIDKGLDSRDTYLQRCKQMYLQRSRGIYRCVNAFVEVQRYL